MIALIPRVLGRLDEDSKYFITYSEQVTRVNGGLLLTMAFSNRAVVFKDSSVTIVKSQLSPYVYRADKKRVLSLEEYAQIHREGAPSYVTNIIMASFKTISELVQFRNKILREVLQLLHMTEKALYQEGVI